MRLETALKQLAAGEFVCSVRFPDEFALLSSEEGRQKAEQWLSAIGYRLVQLGEEGAFFMAYAILDVDAKSKVREELKTLRDRLTPAVMFLETLRQAQYRAAQLQPGDEVIHSEVLERVRTNALLDRRIAEMKDVYGSRATESTSDRLTKILDLLEQDGYLTLTSSSFKVYRVTGKISYLYQLLAFMAENLPEMADGEMSDQMDERQIPLDEASES
ncbi:hypothetical protein [uncultured Hydrogenophaga sp.]|uniref:condensin complex protein MksE n=1 Tax=uncultured Hydrogenophaga sp. TaxID=199683 RepID=UPI00258DF5BB|nr:hypothetical protein [uncultured Hydrogenophaga sp.]